MQALPVDIGGQLHWSQPSSFARHFALHSGNTPIGELHFAGPATAQGTVATAGATPERWTFSSSGILKPRVTIREEGANVDLAVYRAKFYGHGWLEFVNGNRFHWQATGFWASDLGCYDAQKALLYVINTKPFNLLKIQADVEVGAPGHRLDELPVLLMFGWYLLVRDRFASR